MGLSYLRTISVCVSVSSFAWLVAKVARVARAVRAVRYWPWFSSTRTAAHFLVASPYRNTWGDAPLPNHHDSRYGCRYANRLHTILCFFIFSTMAKKIENKKNSSSNRPDLNMKCIRPKDRGYPPSISTASPKSQPTIRRVCVFNSVLFIRCENRPRCY